MFETIKKVAFTGMGVAALTREKVEELAKDLISKGKLTEKEGEKFVQEMVTRAEESKAALKSQTEKIVTSTLGKIPLAKEDDIKELRSEIAKLRQEIEAIKEQNTTP
ncbi:MAG: polyhydroxyalkanoate synthesis regulator phasin [Desulforhopalus sp.]|jgi:polyhydroxyalkanoate synthesis regulator phasin